MNFNKIFSTISFISLISIFNSCSNESNPLIDDVFSLSIYGTVVDEQGKAIEGANVHYIPETYFDSLKSSLKTPPTTIIQFSVTQSGIVDLVILRYGSRDTVAYLIKNQNLQSGVYSYSLDKELTNGVYIYVLKINDLVTEHNMLLLKSPSELITTEPLTTTDKEGKFRLTYKILALGVSFIYTGETSSFPIGRRVISNNISLFLVNNGYQNYLQPMTIDTTISTIQTFRMKKSG